MKLFAVLSILLLATTGQVFGGDCSKAHMTFCTCVDNKVSCGDVNGDIDLSTDFEALAYGFNPGDQNFDYFELNSPTLDTLESNVFHGVTFNQLSFINTRALKCVESGAFIGLDKTTKTFIASYADFSSTEKNCDIFSALSFLTSLEQVNITGSGITTISGFKGAHPNLKGINLSGLQGGQITTINQNAFSSLKSLTSIDLSYNKITKIDVNAFEFFESSDSELTINLEHNTGLNGKSFVAPVFTLGNRKTTLKLGSNNDLDYLPMEVFQTFLASQQEGYNKMDMQGTTLALCPENEWLLKMKVPLNLAEKISNIRSKSDNFWSATDKQMKSGTHMPITTPAGTTVSGATLPGASGTTASGTTASGTTASGTTASGTTASGTTASGSTASKTTPTTTTT